jgi:hypothetical protein
MSEQEDKFMSATIDLTKADYEGQFRERIAALEAEKLSAWQKHAGTVSLLCTIEETHETLRKSFSVVLSQKAELEAENATLREQLSGKTGELESIKNVLSGCGYVIRPEWKCGCPLQLDCGHTWRMRKIIQVKPEWFAEEGEK